MSDSIEERVKRTVRTAGRGLRGDEKKWIIWQILNSKKTYGGLTVVATVAYIAGVFSDPELL